MFITDAYNEQQLPDALLKQITDKVEPFVLEDVNLTESDIEKTPKESEKYNQLVKLVQLRSSLAIIPFMVLNGQEYMVKVYTLSKEYERIASKINADYKPPLIQDEKLALDLFVSFTLDVMNSIDIEKMNSWVDELLTIGELLITINKVNRLAIIKDRSILDVDDIQKQTFYYIYCNCYKLFKDIITLLKNRISDNAIFEESPSISFALRELVNNHINFLYLIKHPEDCQQMLDYLEYFSMYIASQNSTTTLHLKKDFLFKYILSENTKKKIQSNPKEIYRTVKKTRLDRWTKKSQKDLLSEGAYYDENKTHAFYFFKEIHSIFGHSDVLPSNTLTDLKAEKTISFLHLILSIQIYLNITYEFLSMIDVENYNSDLSSIQNRLNEFKQIYSSIDPQLKT